MLCPSQCSAPLLPPLLPPFGGAGISAPNRAIHQAVDEIAQQQPRRHIQHGVLFEKHGGQADQHRCCGEKHPAPPAGEQPRVPGGIPHRHRTHHMERGADVGAGIYAVEKGRDLGQQVLPLKGQGPQVLAGGEQEEDIRLAGWTATTAAASSSTAFRPGSIKTGTGTLTAITPSDLGDIP